jgi:RimJ/RimL family protein N-acetyltransferase
MYTCRPAESTDYSAIAIFPESEEELFFMFPAGTYPLTAEQIEETVKKRWCPTVVLHQNEVVGFANFYGYEEGKHCCLGNFIITKAHRGKGAAECLIRHMIEAAKNDMKVPRLVLGCHHSNPRALLFYKKMNFSPFNLTKVTNRNQEIIVAINMEMIF